MHFEHQFIVYLHDHFHARFLFSSRASIWAIIALDDVSCGSCIGALIAARSALRHGARRALLDLMSGK